MVCQDRLSNRGLSNYKYCRVVTFRIGLPKNVFGLSRQVSQYIVLYNDACVNWTPLGPTSVFGIDNCLVYTG